MNPPFDHHLLSQEALAFGLLLQPLPQRVSVGPVHINLTEHVKMGIVRLSKLLDLSFIAWFLLSETSEKGQNRLVQMLWVRIVMKDITSAMFE